jgi:ribosomal protein S18 acetylase RimI-like enzyme
MGIELRNGLSEDADFLAKITLYSSRGSVGWGVYDVLFPVSDEELLRRLAALCVTTSVSFHHHSQRLVATVDDIPAASLTGFTSGEEARSARALANAEVFTPAELESMTSRRAAIDKCIIYAQPGTLVIENVGTLPQYRRLGLQDRLLKAVLENGRQAGHTRAGVSVAIDNQPAQLAYEKIGFQVVAEKRDPFFAEVMRSPGMRYLELSL